VASIHVKQVQNRIDSAREIFDRADSEDRALSEAERDEIDAAIIAVSRARDEAALEEKWKSLGRDLGGGRELGHAGDGSGRIMGGNPGDGTHREAELMWVPVAYSRSPAASRGAYAWGPSTGSL
jgi:hypothetical protein